MRFVVPLCLLLLALIHALPAIGLLGPARLQQLYGVPVDGPELELLLRHRAVLFGLLAALLAWAAFHPALHRLALLAALASVLSFVLLALALGPLNAALAGVLRVDRAALALLAAAGAAHLLQAGST